MSSMLWCCQQSTMQSEGPIIEVEKDPAKVKTFVTHISLAKASIPEAPVTLRVSDVTVGRPAAGLPVTLLHRDDDNKWHQIETSSTDRSGTCLLLRNKKLELRVYRLHLHTAAYFQETDRPATFILPYVEVTLLVPPELRAVAVDVQISPSAYNVLVTSSPDL